jgi:EAL and modified HD-GYP domain-containing signal transduction protein
MAMLNDAVASSGTVRLVLTRAKACENFAATTIFANPDQAFLTGLLSGVHLLFGVENELFFKQVSLYSEIEIAVLKHSGFLGQILKEVLTAEYSIMQAPAGLADYDNAILSSYLQANDWAEKALNSTLS